MNFPVHKVLIYLFLFCPVISLAQKDAASLKEQGLLLWKQGHYDSALHTFNRALEKAKGDKDSILYAKCLNNIGLVYNSKGEPVKSLFYYNQALLILQNQPDKEMLATALLNIGIAYKEQGVYDKALEYLFQAIDYYGDIKNKKGLASAHNTVANVLMLENILNKALEHHKIALQLRREINFTEGISGSLNNIGIVYKNMGNLDSALYYFKSSLSLKDSTSKENVGNTISHIASIYQVQKRYAEAEQYYTLALDLRLKYKNKKGIASAYYDLGKFNFLQSRLDIAEDYFIKAIFQAEEVSAGQVLLLCYDEIRQLYRKKRDYKKAVLYDDLFIQLKEKILGETQQRALTQMQIKYETEKKQMEIRDLNQDKEKQLLLLKAQDLEIENKRKNINLLSALVILGSVILVLLGLYLYTRIQTSRKQDILFRELHHRIKNNLQILSSLLSLQSIELTDDKARDAVRDGENRVRAMMLIHQKLYFEKQVNKVQIQEYLLDLLNGLTEAYGFHNKLESSLAIPPASMDVDKAISLGLVLNELLSNAFKHAFRNHPKPCLELSLQLTGRIWHLRLSDNGQGLIHSPDARKSFGLRLVDGQLKQLNAQMEIFNNNGAIYKISFPN